MATPAKARAQPDTAQKKEAARPTQRVAARTGARRDAAATQEALVQAAVEEFSRNGFAGARVDEIARAAGVNKQLVYHYFESKQGLYLVALESVYAQIREKEQALSLGALEPVEAMSQLIGMPALFVRKEAKQYGTCKLAEGGPYAGRRVTLIEDVITTGGAVRDATRALRESGAIVDTVVCAIDRSPADVNPLADVDLEVRAVLTKADLDAVRAAAGQG